MTTKTWTKLSDILMDSLAESVDEHDRDTIMNSWNSKKGEVTKLLGGGRRIKKKKDPSAPKKPKTGYLFFCMEKRESVKNKNSDMKATEITRKLGEMWNALSDKDKKKYNKMSEKDKERYNSEMKSYTPPPDEEGEKPKKGKKKENNGPKRPLSSYMYFCQDERDAVKSENPSMKGAEITKELGVRWKALSDKNKSKYEKQALKDKERYEREKAEMGIETKKPEKKSEKKPRAKAIKKTPGYEYFVKEQTDELQDEHPDWSSRKISSEINNKWREMNEEDREPYEIEADELSEHEASDDVSDGDVLEMDD